MSIPSFHPQREEPLTLVEGGTLINVPGRDPNCGLLFQVASHSKAPQCPNDPVQRIFVLLLNIHPKDVKQLDEWEKKLPFPQTDEQCDRYFQLLPGDVVFGRQAWGSGLERDDICLNWIYTAKKVSPTAAKLAEEAFQDVLGKKEDRYQSRGGTLFERSKHAKSVQRNIRCYTCTQSYERQPKLTSLTASLKLGRNGEPLDHNQQAKIKLTKAFVSVALTALCCYPEEVWMPLKERAELLNLPSIGVDNNFAISTIQLNIASPKPRHGGVSLWSDQGAYGVQHCDKGDDCQGLSHCLVGSDLPDNYVPGRFFLLSVGLYFNLLPGLGAQFSGLWYHGGTAPLSDSEEVIPWATRLLAIAYTPFHMVCGESSYALASQAAMARRTDIFCLAPEMMKAQGPQKSSNHTNYAKDGILIMSMHALFQFFVRAMLQLVVFLISQLPEEMNVRVNSDMFLSSFEMQPSPHDTPQSPQPWALAPGWKSKPVLDSMGHPTGHYELVSNKFQRQAVESRLEQRDTYYRWHYISTAADLVQKFSSESSSTPSTSKKRKLQNKKSSNSVQPRKKCRKISDRWFPSRIMPSKKFLQRQLQRRYLKFRRNRIASPEQVIKYDIIPDSPESEENDSIEISTAHIETTLNEVSHNPRLVSFCDGASTSGHLEPGPPESEENNFEATLTTEFERVSQGLHDNDSSDSNHNSDKEHSSIDNMESLSSSDGTSEWQPDEFVEDDDDDSVDNHVNSGDVHLMSSLSQSPSVSGPSQESLSLLHCIEGSVFIQDLEVENMTRELTMLQASLDEVIKYPVLPSILGQALSTIEHLSSNILRHPYDVNSALMISQLWPPLAQIEAHHGTTTLALRIERYRIMETNALPWFWLDKALQCCRSFLAGTPTTEMQGWLIDLVTDVYHYVLNSIRTWHLEPSDYFGSQVNVAPFHYNRLKQRYYDEKDKHDCAAMHEDIIALVKDILVQWLSFPKEFPSRYQATFFMTLETSNLSPLLYLSTTWRAYQSLRSYVFPNTSRGWSLTWFHSLSAVLESHAITSFGSPENNILIDVEACFQKFNDLIKRPRQFLDNTSVMVAPTQPPTNPLTFTSSEAGLLEISNFIKQLLPLLRGQSSSSMSPQQTLVIQNSDFYSPFRELGACRLNITAPGGPFDNSQRSDATASHLCAIEGFAGALIGRGITFATPAGREAKTYFSSLQEWKKLCQSHDDDWIFNLRAYGYPAKHRGIKNASQYFETARKKWPARIRLFKTTGEKISFQAFFKWLKQLGNLLPGMGDLCNYLLTADYVYAGLVTAPTSQEMAESLRRVDAGSLKTLVHLGLVPPRKQDNGQLIPFNQYDQYIVNTLDSLIKHMEEVFSSEERSLMGFDLIMLEHTLCKYLRLQRKGS